MKTKILIITLLVFIQNQLFSQSDLSTQLELSYKNQSIDLLDSFLTNWNKVSIPISSSDYERLSDTIKSVYEIFEKFYNPFALDSIEGREFNNDYYKSISYVIVSTRILIRVVKRILSLSELMRIDSIDYENNKLSEYWINTFYPRLSFPKRKVLYLASVYDSALTKFLKNEYSPLGTGNIMNPAQPIGESKKKVEFLSSKIKVIEGHWGGHWLLATHPDVSTIEFNSSLDTACVNFDLIYQWGEAKFYKNNGSWYFINSKITARE